MKEKLERYVKQVKEWHEDCRGNEQQTKQSLIAPLFTMLGYNMTDPRECKPEYRMDFGKGEKAATPVDWAFLIDGSFAFFVEAKEAGAKLSKYPEQLGMYFGKQPGVNGVKLGILTNGTQWQFFTDLRNDNAMDTEPFFAWDVLKTDPAFPVALLDLLTVLQKSEFTRNRIKKLAEKRHHQTLLVGVIDRLLKPSPEFVKLAIGTGVNDAGDTITSGKITEKVIEQWKPILADAIHEWAKLHDLTIALQHPNTGAELGTTRDDDKPADKPVGVTLADIPRAGVLVPPVKLFRLYKGIRLEATLLAGGGVEFQGQRYGTCSAAAEAARATVSGHRVNTNGWTFWQYQGVDGTLTLADARKRSARSRSKFVGGPKEGNEILRALERVQGQKGGEDQPERRRLRLKFWQGLLSRPKAKTTRHASLTPGDSGWIGAGSGVRGLPYNYVIRQTEGTVELYIDRGAEQTEANKRIFDRLNSHKKDIEFAFGGELSWQRLDEKQGCRIAHTMTVGGYRSDESKWPEIQDALIDAMIRLENALVSHLAKLKIELAS